MAFRLHQSLWVWVAKVGFGYHFSGSGTKKVGFFPRVSGFCIVFGLPSSSLETLTSLESLTDPSLLLVLLVIGKKHALKIYDQFALNTK